MSKFLNWILELNSGGREKTHWQGLVFFFFLFFFFFWFCLAYQLLYSHMQIHAELNNNEDERHSIFRKIYLSLCLKGLCMWEGVGDWTELQHIDPHSYGHQCCVFLVLLMLNRRPGGSAFWWLSLPHLVTNSLGVPRAHSAGWWLSLPHIVSNSSDHQLTYFLTELYNSSIAHSISPHDWPPGCVISPVLGMACLIVIKRK